MNKKMLIMCLVPLLLLGCTEQKDLNPDTDYDGLADTIDSHKNDNKKTLSLKGSVSGVPTQSEEYSFNMDYRLFVDQTGEDVIKDISILASSLTCDIYDSCQATVKDAKYRTRNENDEESIYKELGCEGIEIHNLKDKFEIDSNDTGRFILANHVFSYKKKNYRLIYVTIQGTNGDNEWSSNFDIGFDNENYYSSTGVHTEWENKNEHKGFSVASNRIVNEVNSYIQPFKKTKNILLITGHSRGGALANIVAQRMIDMNYKTFAYTFAAPSTTTGSIKEYKTIHNFLNDDDIVANIPLSTWGFKRYGNEIHRSISKDYANQWSTFHRNTPYVAGNVDNILNGLGSIAATREQLYTYEGTGTISGNSEEDCIDKFNQNFILIPSMKQFFKIERVIKNEDNEKFTLYYSKMPVAVTSLISYLVNGGNIFGLTSIMGIMSEYLLPLLSISGDISRDKMFCPHSPSTYLLLSII